MDSSVVLYRGGDTAAACGELLRSARSAAGLTQSELGRRAGCTQSMLSRWERGHDEPRLSSLVEVLAACGVSLRLVADPDGVDRAHLQAQLRLTPEERLASVGEFSRLLAGGRRLD